MVAPAQVVILAFNSSNQLAVRQAGTRLGLAFVGADEAMANSRLTGCFPLHTPPADWPALTHKAVRERGQSYAVSIGAALAQGRISEEIAAREMKEIG